MLLHTAQQAWVSCSKQWGASLYYIYTRPLFHRTASSLMPAQTIISATSRGHEGRERKKGICLVNVREGETRRRTLDRQARLRVCFLWHNICAPSAFQLPPFCICNNSRKIPPLLVFRLPSSMFPCPSLQACSTKEIPDDDV